jgi:hypothetical protein
VDRLDASKVVISVVVVDDDVWLFAFGDLSEFSKISGRCSA